MIPSQVKEAIKLLYKIKRPGFIWAPPAVGKSDVVRQTIEELSYENIQKQLGELTLLDIRALLYDPPDLKGYPKINDDNFKMVLPDWLPKSGHGMLFLDELPAAPPLTQAALYQLLLDRKIGTSYTLPEGWGVMAAGNRESDKAVAHKMSTALGSRLIHIDFEVDHNDWIKWALNNGIATEVIAFIRFRKELLHKFDPQHMSKEKTFPAPRTWEFLSDILKQIPFFSHDLEFELYKGTVGEATAIEFLGFLKMFRDMVNPDLIMLNPETADIPSEPSTMYAICSALASKASEQTMPQLMKYFNRLPAEFSNLAVTDSKRVCPEIVHTRPYIEWASNHSEMLV